MTILEKMQKTKPADLFRIIDRPTEYGVMDLVYVAICDNWVGYKDGVCFVFRCTPTGGINYDAGTDTSWIYAEQIPAFLLLDRNWDSSGVKVVGMCHKDY